jgi:scyllo-inositol 2-dehydrogenase (NADP+)
MATAPLRCGVIGYGGAFNMGRQHLREMQATGEMVPTAVCDLDPSRTAAAGEDFPGIAVFNSVEEMLATARLDLVTVITPHNTHAALALRVLEAGANVITEKPFCITVEEASRIIETARAKGLMASVYHNRRLDGDFLTIREAIRNGALGEVFHIEASMGGYGHPGTWWRSDKTISGGAFYDWGAHVIDWVLHFLEGKKMQSVTGFFHKRVWHDITNEDHTQAVIRFTDGTYADVQLSSIARAPKPRFRILGTKGGIVDNWGGSFRLYTEAAGYPVEGEVKYQRGEHEKYYRNIADHLLRGESLLVTPESARRIIAVIELAEKSSKSGQPEPVPYEG